MASALQEVLPIEGYERTDATFFAESFADVVELKTVAYIRGEALRKGYESPFWKMKEDEVRTAGRLLVPAVVMDDMRYTALAHGYGVMPEELPVSNALWDVVLDSTIEHTVQSIDGNDAGYVLSCAAHDLSRRALVRVLEKDHQYGEEHRLYNWTVIPEEDEEA